MKKPNVVAVLLIVVIAPAFFILTGFGSNPVALFACSAFSCVLGVTYVWLLLSNAEHEKRFMQWCGLNAEDIIRIAKDSKGLELSVEEALQVIDMLHEGDSCLNQHKEAQVVCAVCDIMSERETTQLSALI